MKNLVEVYSKKELSDNSVIIFQKGQWVAIPKSVFLDGIRKEMLDMQNKITEETGERKQDVNELRVEIEKINNQIKYILGEEEEPQNEEE